MKFLAIIISLIFSSNCFSQYEVLGVETNRARIQINFIYPGNSLVNGSLATTPDSNFVGRLKTYYSNDIHWNQGIPGNRIVFNMLPDYQDSVVARFNSMLRNINIYWEVTNNILTYLITAAQPSQIATDTTYEQYKRFGLFTKNAPAVFTKTYALTCIVRGGGAEVYPFDSCRIAINTRMKANFEALGIGVIAVDEDPRLQDYNNTTYFNPDQVHLTDAGFRVVYEWILTRLLADGFFAKGEAIKMGNEEQKIAA